MEGKLKPFIFYIPTMRQIEYSKSELENKPFGRRGHCDGNRFQKFIGFLNEVVICDLLGLPRPVLPYGVPDKGYDLIIDNVKIDIKTRGFNSRNPRHLFFEHLIAKSQIKPNTPDAFLLTATNRYNRNIIICGYVTKSNLLERGFFKKRGSPLKLNTGQVIPMRADNYVIYNKFLDREGGTPLFRVETQKEGPYAPA